MLIRPLPFIPHFRRWGNSDNYLLNFERPQSQMESCGLFRYKECEHDKSYSGRKDEFNMEKMFDFCRDML